MRRHPARPRRVPPPPRSTDRAHRDAARLAGAALALATAGRGASVDQIVAAYVLCVRESTPGLDEHRAEAIASEVRRGAEAALAAITRAGRPGGRP